MGGTSSKKEMSKIFQIIDLDSSGMIDRLEIAKYMKNNYPNFPIVVVDLFLMLADKDGNGQIDKKEFADFYKVVQASVATDMDLVDIVYTATSVSEGSENITNTRMVNVLRCLGVNVSKEELSNVSFNKEDFQKEVEQFL
ncbi:EF-hand_domain pair-containing protein [Hexamita inflata]|uniref:EF-hand domain pair-containing protein n=1 Tax=Hexamita inflata TaxID=28002 RepID=A0AA86QRX9_9EUKA|nr:EF-hand domain pair-containing protein [Hexamita inflata]